MGVLHSLSAFFLLLGHPCRGPERCIPGQSPRTFNRRFVRAELDKVSEIIGQEPLPVNRPSMPSSATCLALFLYRSHFLTLGSPCRGWKRVAPKRRFARSVQVAPPQRYAA